MNMKKLTGVFIVGCVMVSGCASSSFNEYFNEPVRIVEKSVTTHNSDIPLEVESSTKEESSSVQTFPIEDIRQ